MTTPAIKTVKVSREELYDQVWKTPMRTLANRYGLSDVGLAKTCKSHDIPRPPVGYWAKKEVGKAPPKPPLPLNDDPKRQQIVSVTPSASSRCALGVACWRDDTIRIGAREVGADR